MQSHSLHRHDAVQGFGCSPTSVLQRKWCLYRQTHCLQMQTLYIRLPCLRVLWNLSTCFPNLKIILQSRPSVFKFNLKRAVIFLHKNFRVCNRSKQGELVPTHKFWIRFFKSDFKNTCWASPKPDIQHQNTLVPHLNGRWISKFLGEKFVFGKLSLIHSILRKTGTITSGFKGKKRKYHLLKIWVLLWYALSRAVHKNRTSQVRFSPSKPDLIRPKNACMIVICFLQLLIEPWKPNDRLHGIPGHDPARESRKTPLEGGRKSVQRERYSKFEITLIRKTGTSSSDFSLKFTSKSLKTGTTSS